MDWGQAGLDPGGSGRDAGMKRQGGSQGHREAEQVMAGRGKGVGRTQATHKAQRSASVLPSAQMEER